MSKGKRKRIIIFGYSITTLVIIYAIFLAVYGVLLWGWIKTCDQVHGEYKAIESGVIVDAELNEFIEYMRSKGHHGFGRYCGSGLCHVRWAIKAKILKEKYNIEWHSPATLNPRVRFD